MGKKNINILYSPPSMISWSRKKCVNMFENDEQISWFNEEAEVGELLDVGGLYGAFLVNFGKNILKIF